MGYSRRLPPTGSPDQDHRGLRDGTPNNYYERPQIGVPWHDYDRFPTNVAPGTPATGPPHLSLVLDDHPQVMYNTNKLLSSDATAVGTFLKSGSPTVAEVLAQTELDFLLVDRQHAAPDLETIEAIVRAADLHDTPVLIRIPLGNPDLVTNVLDSGVTGLVIPQVESASQLKELVDASQFTGTRSFALSTRAGRYGRESRNAVVDWAESKLAIVPMIETQAGISEAGTIAALDHVTAVMAGPADIALSLGVSKSSPEHIEAIAEIRAAAEGAGVGFGEYVGSPGGLVDGGGYRSFAVYNSDLGAITAHIDRVL